MAKDNNEEKFLADSHLFGQMRVDVFLHFIEEKGFEGWCAMCLARW